MGHNNNSSSSSSRALPASNTQRRSAAPPAAREERHSYTDASLDDVLIAFNIVHFQLSVCKSCFYACLAEFSLHLHCSDQQTSPLRNTYTESITLNHFSKQSVQLIQSFETSLCEFFNAIPSVVFSVARYYISMAMYLYTDFNWHSDWKCLLFCWPTTTKLFQRESCWDCVKHQCNIKWPDSIQNISYVYSKTSGRHLWLCCWSSKHNIKQRIGYWSEAFSRVFISQVQVQGLFVTYTIIQRVLTSSEMWVRSTPCTVQIL